MTDVVFVLLTIGFFALAAGLVKVCDGFIHSEEIDTGPITPEDEAEGPAEERVGTTGAVGA